MSEEQNFFSILTPYGKSVSRNVFNGGESVKLTHMAVGYGLQDNGNGGYTLDSNQENLKNEWYRFALNSLKVDPNNPAWLIAEGIIRENVGGHWIHEVSINDDTGQAIAICTWPPTYKPTLIEGSSSASVIRVVIEVSDTNNFELVIDGSLALVPRDEFIDKTEELEQSIVTATESVKEWVAGNFIANGAIDPADLVSRDEPNDLTAETSDGKLRVEGAPRPTHAQEPNISNQPEGGAVTIGGEHRLRVSAFVNDGGSLSYQWYSNSVNNATTGLPIEGETGQEYEVPTDVAGTKYYYAVVTNTNNRATMAITASVASDVVSVAVNNFVNAQAPVITSHPASGQYTQNAAASALSVAANVSDGGVLSYQWFRNSVNSNTGGTPIGTNSPTYTPSTAAVGTGYYYVEVTNTIADNGDGGVKTAMTTSDVAVLTINAQQGYTFGARWNKTLSSTQLTRLHDAIGLNFTPAVNGQGGSSDFDNLPIYRDIYLVNTDANGNITHRFGEPGFSRTPVVGDVMVHIGLFYVKILNDNVNRDILISNTKWDNTWDEAPAFKRPDGTVRPYILVSAYTLNSNYRSVSGNQSIVNITRATARTNIRARGSNFSQYDIAIHSTIELLYLVEVANLDSQTAVGKGFTDSSNSGQQNTGGADSIAFHSGSTVASNSGTGRVKYRHMENLWGNIWTWIDGINFNGATAYVSTNPANYADDTTTNYTQLSYTKAAADGYQKAWGFDPAHPWLQLPTDTSGADGTYVPDYYWQSTGWRVLAGGARWTLGTQAGLFALLSIYDSTLATPYVGCRLLVLP